MQEKKKPKLKSSDYLPEKNATNTTFPFLSPTGSLPMISPIVYIEPSLGSYSSEVFPKIQDKNECQSPELPDSNDMSYNPLSLTR